jgi:HK97 family phage prohead protease
MKTFVLCDSSRVNSYGFRTNVEGIGLSRFNTNPVMLYRHFHEDVIGRWENLRIEDGRLLADAVFDDEDELAKKIQGKVERGFIKGCSIGINIMNMKQDAEGVFVAEQTELIEASICAVPADAGAVVLMNANHQRLSLEEAKLEIEQRLNTDIMSKTNQNSTPDAAQLSAQIEEQTAQITALNAQLAERDETLAARDAEIASLNQTLVELRSNAIRDYLQRAADDGRIEASEVEGFARLANSDYDTVRSIIDARPVKATMSLADQTKKGGKTQPDYASLSWDELDRKNLLARLKAENPDLYQKKFAEKFPKA